MDTVTLKGDTLNAIMSKLGTLPYADVYQIINAIQLDVVKLNEEKDEQPKLQGD